MCAGIFLVSVWSVLSLGRASDVGIVMPQSWVLRIMGAFWFVAFLSILTSEVVNISFMAFCYFSVLPLSFFVFAITGRQEQFKFLASLMAIVFAGMAIWALIQFFVFNEHFRGRAYHPLMNPNSLAALFSLVFFCGLGLIFRVQRQWQKIAALAFTGLIFGGIMATGSRGALFAMIPMVLLFLFFIREEVKKEWKPFAVITLICLALIGLSAFGDTVRENMITRFVATVTLDDVDISNNRFSLWLATIGMIKDHGIFGTGIGTYFLYFPEYRLPTDISGAYFAHNDPLQYWAELGILGPVLFYAFVISVLGRTVQAIKKCQTSQQKILILAPFFALGACVLHTHVTFNFSNFSILMTAAFILGFWFWATQQVLHSKTKTIPFPASFTPLTRRLALSLPFVFMVVFFAGYVLSEHYTNKAREHLIAGNLEQFARDITWANKLSFDGNYRSYLLAVNVPMTLLVEGDKIEPERRKEVFNQALKYLLHVEKINPRSASTYYYLAKIQQIVPKDFIPETLDTVENYYKKAIKLDPVHVGARLQLAVLYEGAGDLEKAEAIIKQGAQYRYTTTKALDFYAYQVQFYAKQGKMAEARYAAEKGKSYESFLRKSVARQQKTIKDLVTGK